MLRTTNPVQVVFADAELFTHVPQLFVMTLYVIDGQLNGGGVQVKVNFPGSTSISATEVGGGKGAMIVIIIIMLCVLCNIGLYT